MAFLANLLPGLLASGTNNGGGGGGGLFSSLKNAAGQIFSDLGSGKVNSGADFGKSLARGVSTALGYTAPTNASDKVDSDIASVSNVASTNGADNGAIMNKHLQDYHAPALINKQMSKVTPASTLSVYDAKIPNNPAGVPSGNPSYNFVKKDKMYYKNKIKKMKGRK